MGIRIHSAKKYDVEWNKYGTFNHQQEELYTWLEEGGVEVFCDGDCFNPNWEIDANQLETFIRNTDRKHLKSELEELIKDAYVDEYGYYHFCWF